MRISRADARSLTLSIYPFVLAQLPNTAIVGAALIFINDSNLQRTPGRDVLARMYRLTGAEARLFEAFLAGERLQDYAERSSLSLQTVKTQLSRLFDKTGHSRQTGVVRDAMSNPILSLGKR